MNQHNNGNQSEIKTATNGWYSATVVGLEWHKTKNSNKDRAVLVFELDASYGNERARRGRVINNDDYSQLDEDIRRAGGTGDGSDLPGKKVRICVERGEWGLDVKSITQLNSGPVITSPEAASRFQARFKSAQAQAGSRKPQPAQPVKSSPQSDADDSHGGNGDFDFPPVDGEETPDFG